MVIYGLMLMSFCMLAGVLVGNILGKILGINADVGGVGFAMLFLILLSNYLLEKNNLSAKAQEGIQFWSNMYIPIVIAMSASQNVIKALSGGPLALLAGFFAVVLSFLFVPVLTKLAHKPKNNETLPNEYSEIEPK